LTSCTLLKSIYLRLNYAMVVILAPYYFSHKLALQLCGAKVAVCPFDRSTLLPDWAVLQQIMTDERPKMVNSDQFAIPAFANLLSMISQREGILNASFLV
jgi:hypothetical protein